jgi:hypothetical protein
MNILEAVSVIILILFSNIVLLNWLIKSAIWVKYPLLGLLYLIILTFYNIFIRALYIDNSY